jgi:hypothetical protein
MEQNDWTQIDYINTIPTKKILRNKASVCNIGSGIGEIIDNCIDFWRECDRKDNLKINIQLNPTTDDDSGSILVNWNLGIPRERFKPLLTMGSTQHKDPSSIGLWGEGFKIGLFSIGRKITITTKDEETPFRIIIPSEWIDNDDWNIPYSSSNTFKFLDNFTEVIISEPDKRKPIPKSIQEIKDYLGDTYGTLIKKEEANGHKINIKINEQEIFWNSYVLNSDLQNKFCFPPEFEPSEHLFEWEGLKVKMIIGLLAEADAQNYGVYMYGMDRLFAKGLNNEYVGFGDRQNSVIPKDHPYVKRLQVHIFFEGRNELIPWNAPLKDGYNTRNFNSKKIKDSIIEYAGPYVAFVKGTKQSEFLPYSKKWNTLSDDDKKIKFLRPDIESKKISSEEINSEWDKVPTKIKETFKPKQIEVWDHSINVRRPSPSPKFDITDAKKVSKYIKTQRDTGEISTIDVANYLSGKKTSVFKKELSVNGNESVEKSIMYEQNDETRPVSVRLSQTQIKKLKINSGTSNNSEMLKKVVDIYFELISLKKHPSIFGKYKHVEDIELIKILKEILNEENK